MNFTRKRPRDGPQEPPPPKRHDHKPQERYAAAPAPAPMKPPSSSVARPPSQPEAPRTVAKKPIPPPPSKASQTAEETPKYNVADPELKTDLPALFTLLDTVRNLSTDMVEKSLSLGPEEAKSDATIQELGRQGFIALAQYRTLHRHLHSEVDRRRQQVLKYGEKDFLEALQLSQSSKYQLEVFKSLVELKPDLDLAIGLVSEEDWLKESVGPLLRPKEGDSPHKLTLKRIKHEEEQRKALAAKLKEIPSKQSSLKSTLNAQTRDLEALKQKVREMVSQMNTLKTSLKLEEPTLQQADPRAAFLPQPLYNLYVQLISWISVFGGEQVEVSIGGLLEAAKKSFARHTSQAGSKASSSSFSVTGSNIQPLSSEKCQATHLLSVLVHFLVVTPSSATSRKISIMFEYLMNLHIVIVTPLNNEDPRILVNLFPNDDGLVSPNWSNHLQVAAGVQVLPKRARAYKWVQALSGLHFPQGPSESVEVSSPFQPSSLAHLAASLTDTMELLKRRTQMKHTLMSLWSMLVSGRIEIDIPPSRPRDLPQVTSLRKWTEQTTAQAQTILNEAQAYYKEHNIHVGTKRDFRPKKDSASGLDMATASSSATMDIDSSAHSGSPSAAKVEWFDDCVSFDAKQDSFYYRAAFGNSGTSQACQVLVEIPPEYPSANPTFYITGSKDLPPSEVQLMIQVLTRSLQPIISDKRPETLVNYTLTWIRDCLDIYHDLKKQGDSSKFQTEDRYDPATHHPRSG